MDDLALLLLEDIPGLGQRNDIVVVGDGYALNNLLPRRRAIVATPTVRKRYAEQIRRRAEEKAHELDLARNAASVLKEKGVSFAAKVAKTGKLFGAISPKMIAEALTEQLQIEVPEANISLDEHIKTVGEHKATVKIGSQELELKIVVKSEGV